MDNIGIIVPVYNVELYLDDCIRSIINQTYNNFRLVLVDDGSTDKSPIICDEYAKRDNRISVIHQENSGQSFARNVGLDFIFSRAKSRYLTFIDADDYVSPHFLETLINNVGNNDIIMCNFSEIDSDKKPCLFENERMLNKHSFWTYKFNSIVGNVVWGKLYDVNLFISLRFPLIDIIEDEFLIPKIVDRCSSIIYIKDVLYFHRNREGSVMKSKTYFERNMIVLDCIKERIDFALKTDNYELLNMSISQFLIKSSQLKSIRNLTKEKKRLLNKKSFDINHLISTINKEIIWKTTKNKLFVFHISKRLYLLLYKIRNKL